jgi:hypothetical protein
MSTVFEASYTELKKAEARSEKLLAALKKYGLHLGHCPANDGKKKCNCGLDKILKRLKTA